MASYTGQLTIFFERCIPVHHVDLEKKVIVENRFKGKNAVMALVHDSPDPATADLPFKALQHVLRKNHVGVVKSPIYCVAAIFQALDIPYVLSRT